jgi:hypothetical protein
MSETNTVPSTGTAAAGDTPAAKQRGRKTTRTAGEPQPAAKSDGRSGEAAKRGREEARVVKQYLGALEVSRPRRGPKPSPEKITAKLAKISEEIENASPLKRLDMLQEQIELYNQLEQLQQSTDIAELENEFVRVARNYSERRGLTEQAWKAVGVSSDVIERAGLKDRG